MASIIAKKFMQKIDGICRFCLKYGLDVRKRQKTIQYSNPCFEKCFLYSQLTWKFKHTYVSWLSNNCHDTIMMWALRPLCKYQMTYFSLSLLQVEKWSWTSCRRGCTASTRSQCSWRNGKTCQIWQPRGWSQISYWSGLEK